MLVRFDPAFAIKFRNSLTFLGAVRLLKNLNVPVVRLEIVILTFSC